ncbi:unnamed protein product [Linum trigynum]|uniref:Bet v I/Major latex protein domain-containing protein n=1 Tax=Linum trigynum TaxID=586398 RepID=A0AAV2EJV4_9ROSI
MAMKGKLQSEMEVKASADKVYHVLRKTSHHIPNHTSKNIHGVEVHEGDWETSGSIKNWKYTIDGKPEVLKEKMLFDDEKKLVTLIGLEGDAMKLYKVYTAKFEIKPKDVAGGGSGNGSIVSITVEYEKLNPSCPPPYKYLDFLESAFQDITEAVA